MLLLHYEEHHFGGLPAAQYWRTADIAFAPSSVRVPLVRPPPGSTLHHIRTALSTTLPPPGLNLSLTPGSQGQFPGSTPSSSSHQASPAPFGHPSRLTDAANFVAASRARSQQAGLTLFADSPAVLGISLQPFNAFTAAVEPAVHTRRRSGPAAVSSPSPHSPPHVQPVTAAAAAPQPLARAAPAFAPPQPSEQIRSHSPFPLPTRSLRPNALLLPFPRPVRLRAALQRPARPRIPSHLVARSITRETPRLTRRVDRSAGRRPHQLRLRLSNLRVLVRPRSSRKSRARLRLPCPRRPRRREALPPSHPPRPSRQRRSRRSHVSRARASAVWKTRARPLCLSRSRLPQALRLCRAQSLAQPLSRLRPPLPPLPR